MPSAINWIVPQRVLLTSLNGDMSKEDFVNFMTEIRAQIAQGQKPVYHISDSMGLGKVELSLRAFQDLLKSLSMFSELTWQIDVNTHGLNKMLAAVASQFVGVRTRTVPTMDEAIAFLKRIEPEFEHTVWTMPVLQPSIVEPTQQ